MTIGECFIKLTKNGMLKDSEKIQKHKNKMSIKSNKLVLKFEN